ncbi:MAG: hypothetical protein ABSB00_03065 [Minisyncoccia bacterium]|jgi:hypothetical protein
MKSHFFHFIIALMVAIAALIGYGFWYTTIAHESAVVANLQSEITAKTETVNQIVSAQTAFAEITEDEAALQGYFVPGTSVVSFIDGLEAQGKSLRAIVSVLSVSTGSIGKQSTLLLSLTIKGTFNAVMRTVGAIEYAPYDLSISNISLAQDDKNSWHADLNLLVGSVSTATGTP